MVTGFHVDEQQCISVPSGWAWNDKAGLRWRAADFDAPPPKSRLLASEPNYIDQTPWLAASNEINAMDNERAPSDAVDWGKR